MNPNAYNAIINKKCDYSKFKLELYSKNENLIV